MFSQGSQSPTLAAECWLFLHLGKPRLLEIHGAVWGLASYVPV